MSDVSHEEPLQQRETQALPPLALGVLLSLCAAKVIAHLFNDGSYGYFRDELYYLACADRLAFGYVDHPPLSILVLDVTRAIFGEALWAIRLPVVLAGAATVFMTGLLAREMGGGRAAQGLAALCVLVSPGILALAGFYSMNGLDVLFWVLGAYVLARIVRLDWPQGWLWFGGIAGLGLQNKISMLFFGFGVVVGLLLTPHRKYFLKPQLYAGGLLAAVVFLPHLVWQFRTGWPTLEFMHNASTHKNVGGASVEFAMSQVLFMHPLGLLVVLLGLCYALFAPGMQRYRLFAWAFLSVLAILLLNNGKAYYLVPTYPMMYALGAIGLERAGGLDTHKGRLRTAQGLLAVTGLLFAPFAIPVLPPEQLLGYMETLHLRAPRQETGHAGVLDQHLGDRFGWPEMVETIHTVVQALPAEDRAQAAILVTNYGRAGALEFFGRDLELPPVICMHNNYYLWGYEGEPGAVMITMGVPEAQLREVFDEVTEAARTHAAYAMPYEDNVPIFVCRGLRRPFAEIWAQVKSFT